MIKVTDKDTRVALRVCLTITRQIEIEPGSISARCRNAAVTVTCEHNIPTGKYICRDYFLNPHAFIPARRMVTPTLETEYLGQIPAAPAWQMQMDLAELIGQVFNTRHLKALSVLYKGDPVTVLRDQNIIFLTVHNITLTLFPRVYTTRVLITGMPVTQHQALKDLAVTRKTSVNKIILAIINKEVRNETDY